MSASDGGPEQSSAFLASGPLWGVRRAGKTEQAVLQAAVQPAVQQPPCTALALSCIFFRRASFRSFRAFPRVDLNFSRCLWPSDERSVFYFWVRLLIHLLSPSEFLLYFKTYFYALIVCRACRILQRISLKTRMSVGRLRVVLAQILRIQFPLVPFRPDFAARGGGWGVYGRFLFHCVFFFSFCEEHIGLRCWASTTAAPTRTNGWRVRSQLARGPPEQCFFGSGFN